MDYHLVCVREYGKYTIGMHVYDADEIVKLLSEDRDHNFVKISSSAIAVPEPEAPPFKKSKVF